MLMPRRYPFATTILFAFALTLAAFPALAQDHDLLNMPAFDILSGNILLSESFDDEAAWETYVDPTGIEFGVDDGMYRAYSMNPGYVWGLNAQLHTDAIIEVEVMPMNVNFENGFGVMCRADVENNGDGYYFMINANGYFFIGKGDGPSITPLIDWSQSEAVHQQLDLNSIRAVCSDDVLALYINDVFVAQVNDSTYTEGFTGLAIAGSPTGDADVAFDNLVVYQVLAR